MTDLWELVEQAAVTHADRTMFVSRQGDRCTFAEFRDRAERMAAGLSERGIRAGDVVSWVLPTWGDTVVWAAALSRLGVVQNPIIHIYRDREVGFCVRQTGARVLAVPGTFAGFDFAALGARVTDGTATDVLVLTPGEFPGGDPAVLPPHSPAGPRDTRWICYTSGTTADPKGARHSHATVGSFPRAMAERMHVTAESRYALTFPFPHIGGIGLLFMAMQTGCTLLLDAGVHPADTVGFLAEQRCTHAGTGSAFFSMYLAVQAERAERLFPDIVVFPAGGAPTPVGIHRRVRAELGAPVVSAWGMTEAPVLTSGATEDAPDLLETTEGRPMPGVTIDVVADDGTPCPVGVTGELRVRGPQVMLGHEDPALDAEAFDDEGRLRTGDLGHVTADGHVVISGRLKDVIIRSGENISAKEVEDLVSAMPEVADVAVVGLPDSRTGERVCAVVVLRDVVLRDGVDLTLDQVRDRLAEAGIRRQALPEQVEIVDVLPRNPAGKVRKQDLIARYGS